VPEEPEIDSERLHAAIDEELEKEGGRFLRQIALTTAILAVCASVASLQAGSTVNEALVLKTESTRLQAEASDQWAYYQAKGLKAAIKEAAASSWAASGKPEPAEYAKQVTRYEDEQKEIQAKAREIEQERDQKDKEAAVLLARHHGFAAAVALFQVSIALGAIAALTRNRLVWYGSVAVGAAGLVMIVVKMMG
jgi:Domain of unknown function (DUF4337)